MVPRIKHIAVTRLVFAHARASHKQPVPLPAPQLKIKEFKQSQARVGAQLACHGFAPEMVNQPYSWNPPLAHLAETRRRYVWFVLTH